MSKKDGLVDLKGIIKAAEEVRDKCSKAGRLSHNTVGKGIGFYSNGDGSYQTIAIDSLNTGVGNIVKVVFTSTSYRIEMDKDYINKRSLGAIHKRLKAIV